MDIYKRMAAKIKTCRKRQCKRGTVKWRGGTKWGKVDTTGIGTGMKPYPLQKPDEGRMTENPLTKKATAAPAPRQTTSTPAEPPTASRTPATQRPATQRQTTLVSSSTSAATRQPASRESLAPAAPRPRQTQTATPIPIQIQSTIAQAAPKKISLDKPTPARQSLKTETQNGNSYSSYYSNLNYKDEKYSDIKNYVDFKKLPNREIKTEDDIKNAAVDLKDPQAKIFNDYIKSRYKYFISKDKYNKYNPLRYYYKKEYINAEKEKKEKVDRGRFLVNEDKPKPMNTKPVNTKPGDNHVTI